MSVKAYRVTRFEFEEASFTLWQDEEFDEDLVKFLDVEYGFSDKLDLEGDGVVKLPVEALERALKGLDLDDEVKEALQKDLEACKADGYVTYYCF